MIPIGATLKLLGDEEFVVDTIKLFFKVGQLISEILGAAIKLGMGIQIRPEDFPSLTNFERAWDKAVEQISIEERDIFGDKPPMFPAATTQSFRDAKIELIELFTSGKIGADKFHTKMGELETEYSEQIKWIGEWEGAMDQWKDRSIEDIDEVKHKMEDLSAGMRAFITPKIFGIPLYQKGGIVSETGPAILHAGERVIPRNEVGREGDVTTISPIVTYNITVQDKFEMERLMKENNLKLVEDIKRQVNV